MRLTFAPRGILQIDDARITFCNFEGRATDYNEPGNRNFALIIDDEDMASELMNQGWNVKIKAPRDKDDIPFMYLPVKVAFNDWGPNIYLRTSERGRAQKLTVDTVKRLDRIRFERVDLDIRPYDWTRRGNSGRTAYLKSLDALQSVEDRFALRYSEEDIDTPPFA